MTVSKDRNLFFFVSMVDLLRALINNVFFLLHMKQSIPTLLINIINSGICNRELQKQGSRIQL